MQENQIKGGLKLIPLDPRTFKLGSIFSLPVVENLPTDFRLPATKIKNQLATNLNNDKCAAYSSTSASEIEEGLELNPDYTFAAGKDLANEDVNTFGLSLIDIMNAHVKVGAIEQKDVPVGIDVEDPKYRYFKNWPADLMQKAYLNKKESYFNVNRTNGQDFFDSIKSAIWKFKDKKQAVVFGCEWNWPLQQVYMSEPQTSGVGHAMEIVGWSRRNGDDWLVVQNSAGTGAGEQGYHLFSRKIINASAQQWGALMLVDMPREDAEWYLNNNIKQSDNWIFVTFKMLLSSKLIEMLQTLIGLKKMQQTLLDKFCKAIQAHEGWYPGSTSYRNNNPGNLRYVGQASATGHDARNFCIFPSYDVGYTALTDMVRNAATGLSHVYTPDMTFQQFFHTYAPSGDNNDPDAYAKAVATACGVSITTQIKTLVA